MTVDWPLRDEITWQWPSGQCADDLYAKPQRARSVRSHPKIGKIARKAATSDETHFATSLAIVETERFQMRTNHVRPAHPTPYRAIDAASRSEPVHALAFNEPEGRKRMTHFKFARQLEEIARSVQSVGCADCTKIYFAVDDLSLSTPAIHILCSAAKSMFVGSIHRLENNQSPEILLMVRSKDGEIQFSTIDNSSTLPNIYEVQNIQRLILPLGGIHSSRRKGQLIESAFSFLVRQKFCPG